MAFETLFLTNFDLRLLIVLMFRLPPLQCDEDFNFYTEMHV